jgi:4-oxalocrotonate tautomerase
MAMPVFCNDAVKYGSSSAEDHAAHIAGVIFLIYSCIANQLEKIMPILNVKVSTQKSAAMTKQISDLLLDLTTRILRKKREVTAIAIDYIDHDCWVVGGSLLSEQNKNSFYFNIKITDETNTKDEKALYIKEAFAGFERILGNLHEESYIHVEDVKAASYGYGGLTQEYRYHH